MTAVGQVNDRIDSPSSRHIIADIGGIDARSGLLPSTHVAVSLLTGISQIADRVVLANLQ
jgi:hypothetical protein